MEKIKYRTWNKIEKRWADHNEQMSEVNVGAAVNPPSVLTIGSEKYDLQLFTGLMDKNGKEIYEGDIISFPDMGEEGYEYKEGFDFTNTAAVTFENGRFELTNFRSNNSAVLEEMNSESHEDFINVFKSSEVISNIYELKE
ncbi:YopX family protein [Terribacillus saccharophilus]|uniref:YopX family protein n=1 Tax=Terribacillus saccharophilus TaxID=361277 RepID=UPI0038060845